MTFTDPNGVAYFRLAAIKQGLKAIKLGMRVNRAYTPGNLRKIVEKESGKKFKARDYDGMLGAVEELMEDLLKKAHDKGLKAE